MLAPGRSGPPLDGSLTYLTDSPGLFTICKLFRDPQPQEAQSLKHLKDTEPFLRAKNPIGDGFSLLTQ